ncbi:hypothetical protein KQI63_10175 [bacterium]|nr:hypothetical protein [bacterium]
MKDGISSGAIRGLVLLVLGKLLFLVWLAWHGFPPMQRDPYFFQQTALCWLNSGSLANPNLAGWIPYIDQFVVAYPVTAFAWFVPPFLFGSPSPTLMLLYSMLPHLVLSALGSWWVFRNTRSFLLVALFLFLQTMVLDPVGRPDEFALLTGFLALMVNRRDLVRSVLAVLLFAITLTTSPISGHLFLLLWGVSEWIRARTETFRILVVLVLSELALVAIWGGAILVQGVAGWDQFFAAVGVSSSWSYRQYAFRGSFSLSFFPLLSFTMAYGFMQWNRLAAIFKWGNLHLVKSGFILLPISTLYLMLIFSRRDYDLRFTLFLAILLSLPLLADLIRRVGKHRITGWILIVLFTFGGIASLADEISYAISPMLYGGDRVDWRTSFDQVRELSAREEIGGRSSFWLAVEQPDRYVAIDFASDDHWPPLIVTPVDPWLESIALRVPSFAELTARGGYKLVEDGLAGKVPQTLPGSTILLPSRRMRAGWAFRLYRRDDGVEGIPDSTSAPPIDE